MNFFLRDNGQSASTMSTTKAQQNPEENLIRYGQLEDELGGSIRTAERRLSQAIHANRLKQKELQRFDKEYTDLDNLLEDLPKKLSHKIMVPLSTVAFMPGEIYNTNKVKVLLGENYFVKCSTSHAQSILRRRQEFIKESMTQIEKQFKELKTRVGLANEMLDVSEADGLVEIREDYNSDEEPVPLKLAPATAQKPKIEVISSKAAHDESDEDDDDEDENMRMINEYLRREEGEDEDDSDEEYFEQDPGPVQDIQEQMAKQSLGSNKPKAPVSSAEKQPLKSAMKQTKPVIEASEPDLDMPPLISISAKSGKVVDQLPTIKSSASKSASSEPKTAKKGVSFADPTPIKKIVEKPMQDNEDEDKFVVNMRDILGVALASGLGLVALNKLKSRAQSRARPKRLPKRKVNGAGKSSCVDLVAGFDLDADLLGNKAYHLTNLKALNHNVPSAFVVTSVVYEKHIQRCNCDDLIASLADASLSDVQIEENCSKIREKILSTEVAPDLLTECQQFLSKLEGPLGVAVRSSSNQEDSQGKAFAGQFETHLNVTKNAKEVTDKIKQVWASLWAPHVILYRHKMTTNGASALPAMSVLVQEMVDSAVSGVIFSVNPFGMFTEAMIESYFGQGESLVSGEISPDQFVINRSDRKIVKQTVNVHKKYATYANKHGGLVKTELAPSLATSPSLTASQINQIVDLALDVENEFEAPQDIEFALDKSGKIFLLQARPITTGTKKYSFLTEWKPPGPGIWTKENAHVPTPVTKLCGIAMSKNIVEGMRYSSTQMCSPLETIDQKVVNGFVYTSPRSVGAPPSANGPPPKWIFKALVRIHPTLRKRLGGIENVYKTKVWRKSMDFWLTEDRTNRINQTVALSSVDVTALSDNELLAHFKKCFEHWGLMVRHHHVYTFTSIIAVGDYLVQLKKWGIELIDGMQLLSGLDSISYGVETFAVDDVYKAFKEDAEALRILKNSEEKPEVVLEQLRSRSGPVKEALKKYTLLAGFRPSKGYDIDQPTVQEVPQLFLEGLRKTYDYGAKEFVIHPASQEEINAVRNRVPEKDRAQFDDLLAEAQYMYPLRDERAMYCDLLSAGAVRFAVLEIGKRLVQKKILPRAELAINASDEELTLMMTKPNTDHSALVATLQEWEEYRRTIDPGTVPEFLGGTPAEPPPADWFPDPYSRRMMESVSLVVPMVLGSGRPNPAGQALEDKKVIGTSGSRGVVEGRVKIVKSLATDQHKFEKGDILVTYCTSSSFCLLLSQSAAVITEEGGALSHAAITARELHIPAVVAARNATQVLQDGMLVRVDGNTGIVQIL